MHLTGRLQGRIRITGPVCGQLVRSKGSSYPGKCPSSPVLDLLIFLIWAQFRPPVLAGRVVGLPGSDLFSSEGSGSDRLGSDRLGSSCSLQSDQLPSSEIFSQSGRKWSKYSGFHLNGHIKPSYSGVTSESCDVTINFTLCPEPHARTNTRPTLASS